MVRGQATGFHGPHVQLDLRPSGLQDVEAVIGRPLEERPQVVAVGVQRPPLVAGQERRGGQFRFVDGVVPLGGALDLGHRHQFGHWNLPESVRSPAKLLPGGCAVPGARRRGAPATRRRASRSESTTSL